MPSKTEAGEIRRLLRGRAAELREDIQRELRKYENETYNQLADEVADSGNQSWADLVSDVNIAEVTRDLDEIRDIDLALQRLAEGSYGICIDCGQEIDPERLEANPAAVRCIEDQRRFENRDRKKHYHTL